MTSERLIEGWSGLTAGAVAGRHVLAIQDTSEIGFNTTGQRTRGLGEIGKGRSRGALLHAMLAVDAQDGACLGLVGGAIWTRPGRITVAHSRRELADKESKRWLDTARRARTVLDQAACITVIADRESDIYAEWASLPTQAASVTRVMHDRALADGGTLYQAADRLSVTDTRTIDCEPRTSGRRALTRPALRSGPAQASPPTGLKGLPDAVSLTLVEAVEPIRPTASSRAWRLLTTHPIAKEAAAWQIVDWYKKRWLIEQLFRVSQAHACASRTASSTAPTC